MHGVAQIDPHLFKLPLELDQLIFNPSMLVLIPDGMESTERSAGHEACLTCMTAQERRGSSKWTRFTVRSRFCSVSVDDCFGLKLLLVIFKGSSFVPPM